MTEKETTKVVKYTTEQHNHCQEVVIDRASVGMFNEASCQVFIISESLFSLMLER